MANKPVVKNIESGRINPDTLDGNFDTLSENFENVLGRGGVDESYNSMLGDLDMNDHRVRNVGTPITSGDAVSLSHLNTILSQGSISDGLVVVYEQFTATGGQTVFMFEDISYTQGVSNLSVFLKENSATESGYRRLSPDEYQETSPISFTLYSGASAGDKLLAYVGQTVETTATGVAEHAYAAAASASEAADYAAAAEAAAEGISADSLLTKENNLSDVTDASASRSNLGLEIGVDVEAAFSKNTAFNLDKSSQAQAEAGTNDTTLMTPLQTANAISALTPASSGIPTGTVMHFAGVAAPSGWLIRDGSAISRSTYADLFAVIGTLFGVGDGSTTFNLPDDRNLFDRGVPDGGTVGTYQEDAFKSHSHTISVGSGTGGYITLGSELSSSRATSATGDTETRPKNRHYLPIIKY